MKSYEEFESRISKKVRELWPTIHSWVVNAVPESKRGLFKEVDHPSYTVATLADVETLAGNLHYIACWTIQRHGARSEFAVRVDTMCRWIHELLFDTAEAPRLEAAIRSWEGL